MSVQPSTILALLFLAVTAVVSVWDIIAFALGHGEETVSDIIGRWSREFPMLGVAIGVLIGHLFWPRGRR